MKLGIFGKIFWDAHFYRLLYDKFVRLISDRSLLRLVSHWPVESQSAAALTTRMLKEAKDKTVGRAEALKRSMLAVINTPGKPYLAHPMFWAPFTVVGEGN